MPFPFRISLRTAVRFATIAILVLIVCQAAVALDPRKSIGQFIHQAWQR